MTRPSTLVVVHTCGAKGLDAARLQRQASLPYAAILPSPERAVYPQGSLTESYVYRLSRPDDTLKPLTAIDGSHLRTMRDIAHKARKQGGRVHVVGVLDTDSPVGSRRALESLLRQAQGVGLPLVIHPAMWHVSPSEAEYGLRELQTFLVPGQTELGALFDLHSQTGAPLPSRFHTALPEHALLTPSDIVVIANHDMHGLHPFAEGMRDRYGVTVVALPHESVPAPRIVDSLSRQKHIMTAVNRASYERAYVGTVSHPYYESYQHPKSSDLLGMLVSPHFSSKADHLFVGVDAQSDSEFVHGLRSLLQQQSDTSLVCCLIDPHGIDRSLVLANVPLESNGSLYHHIHRVVS